MHRRLRSAIAILRCLIGVATAGVKQMKTKSEFHKGATFYLVHVTQLLILPGYIPPVWGSEPDETSWPSLYN